MAKMVLLASFLSLNASDLSEYTSKIELSTEVEEQDTTTFKSLGWKEVEAGLASGSLSITFKQDVAVGKIDEIMWALFRTKVPFVVRLSQAAVSASNPAYSGTVLISKWVPIAGEVGAVAEVEVEYPTSGAVTRAIV